MEFEIERVFVRENGPAQRAVLIWVVPEAHHRVWNCLVLDSGNVP